MITIHIDGVLNLWNWFPSIKVNTCALIRDGVWTVHMRRPLSTVFRSASRLALTLIWVLQPPQKLLCHQETARDCSALIQHPL